MTRKSRCFCLGLYFIKLFVFVPSVATGQQVMHKETASLKPVFRHYTVTRGLPSHEVHCLLQDSRGYIWFGTDRGVARFNGYHFDVFTTEQGMCDNTVFNIYEDKKGRIWFATFSGKLSYFQDGLIKGIAANPALEELRGRADISSISVDAGDTLWLGLARSPGIIKIAPGSAGIVWLKTFPGSYLKVFPNGELLPGYTECDSCKGLFLSVEVKGKRKALALGKYRFTEWLRTPRALKTGEREFLYATGKLILRLSDTAIEDHYYYPGQVNNIFRDSKGQVWVCNGNNGVSKLSKDPSSTYLKGLTVTAATEDSEGNLWFTTLENGVFMLPSPHFRSYTLDNKTNITRFTVNKEGLWAGLEDGRLLKLDPDKLTFIKLPSAGKEAACLRSISAGSDGNLLVGGNRTYLFGNGKFKPVFDIGVKHLTRGANGSTLGAMVESIYLYENGRMRHLLTDSRFKKYIDALCQDNEGVIWVGNLYGLWSYNKDKLVYHGSSDSLLSMRIRDIGVSQDGKLWLATLGAGLVLKQGNKLYQINTQNGLLSNMCNSLYIEREDIVWVCTNKGLNRVHIIDPEKKKYAIESYTSLDGLLSDEVLYVIKHRDLVWVSNGDGITCFDPEKIQGAQVPPPVYISDFQVNGIQTSSSAIARLNHKQNLVDIDYIGISFRSSDKLVYRYQLQGWEQEWNYTNNTSVRYPNLPPGSYTFMVYAQNRKQAWSSEPAMVTFTISKPFWQTGWFIFSSGFVCFILVGGSFSYRINSIKKRERENNLLHKKQVELELKALRAQMNPHFTFNTMNSIQDYISQKDTGSASDYLVMFASLMRRVLNNSRKAYIKLQEELEAVKLYLELEVMRLDGRFNYTISCDDELYLGYEKVPPLFIQPYVENAIWHGIMPKQGKGELNIRISKSEDKLLCTIRDNGIGRKRAEELKTERGTKHESMGMNITDERLRLLNEITSNRISVKFNDLVDDAGNASGTEVEITFSSYNA